VETIQAVVVDQIFDPKTTPSAWVIVINSADKNEINITEIKDELWTIVVEKNQVDIALKRVFVDFAINLSNVPPLKSLNQSSIKTIQTKNIATQDAICVASLLIKKAYHKDMNKAGNTNFLIMIYLFYVYFFNKMKRILDLHLIFQ